MYTNLCWLGKVCDGELLTQKRVANFLEIIYFSFITLRAFYLALGGNYYKNGIWKLSISLEIFTPWIEYI